MPRDISRKRVFGYMTAAAHWSDGCWWRLWYLEINTIDVHFQWLLLNKRGVEVYEKESLLTFQIFL